MNRGHIICDRSTYQSVKRCEGGGGGGSQGRIVTSNSTKGKSLIHLKKSVGMGGGGRERTEGLGVG